MAQHARYWSCTKFADFIRGTPKPRSATSAEWDSWEENSSSKNPIRHWISETLLDTIQDFITFPTRKFQDFQNYYCNRWISKSNSLTASKDFITPGEWCDVGNRFLPCMFNELVDFIEIECAWMNIVCDEKKRKQHAIPLFRKFKKWRSPELGLDYLRWEMELTNTDFVDADDPEYGMPTTQALSAKEQLDLYRWWKYIRPERKDPMELSGWSAYCENNRGKFLSERSEEGREECRKILDRLHAIEKQYEEEDEEMMIRLIKIRNSLWT